MPTGAPCSTFAINAATVILPICPPKTKETLASLDGLGVEVEQSTVRVVSLLQNFVGRAAVRRPELILGVERGGVQRLAPVESRHLALDGPIVERLGLPGREVDAAPEADVDVGRRRVERIEVPADLRVALHQWAHPHGCHPGLPVEEVEELGEARRGHLDVLDDVLDVRLAAGPVDPGLDA